MSTDEFKRVREWLACGREYAVPWHPGLPCDGREREDEAWALRCASDMPRTHRRMLSRALMRRERRREEEKRRGVGWRGREVEKRQRRAG